MPDADPFSKCYILPSIRHNARAETTKRFLLLLVGCGLSLGGVLLCNLGSLLLLDGGVNLGTSAWLVAVVKGGLSWVWSREVGPCLLLGLVLLLSLDAVGKRSLVLVVGL